jgi:hypothetical protein
VGSLRAHVGGEPQDLRPIQLRGGGRRQVVTDDDRRLGEHQGSATSAIIAKMIQHALRDVPNVGGALAKVGVIERGEQLDVLPRHVAVSGVRVDFLLPNAPRRAIEKLGILEDQ